jgi:hypothetical protein
MEKSTEIQRIGVYEANKMIGAGLPNQFSDPLGKDHLATKTW